MALRLYSRGIRRVHPLEGGIEAWRAGALPLEEVAVLAAPAADPA